MVLKHIRCIDIRPKESADRDSRAEVEMLADSIRRHGVLRPVLLRSTEVGFEIVHGERRWRAARMIGLEVIPAFLVESLREEHATA